MAHVFAHLTRTSLNEMYARLTQSSMTASDIVFYREKLGPSLFSDLFGALGIVNVPLMYR